eukprot:441495-Rhodomonas_salina.1
MQDLSTARRVGHDSIHAISYRTSVPHAVSAPLAANRQRPPCAISDNIIRYLSTAHREGQERSLPAFAAQ